MALCERQKRCRFDNVAINEIARQLPRRACQVDNKNGSVTFRLQSCAHSRSEGSPSTMERSAREIWRQISHSSRVERYCKEVADFRLVFCCEHNKIDGVSQNVRCLKKKMSTVNQVHISQSINSILFWYLIFPMDKLKGIEK